MTPHLQIITYSRHTAGMIRIAKRSRTPRHLLASVRQRLEALWDMGCHSDRLSSSEKQTARRCCNALELMISR